MACAPAHQASLNFFDRLGRSMFLRRRNHFSTFLTGRSHCLAKLSSSAWKTGEAARSDPDSKVRQGNISHDPPESPAGAPGKSVQAKASFWKLSVPSVKMWDSRKSFNSPLINWLLMLMLKLLFFYVNFPSFELVLSPHVSCQITSSPCLQGPNPLNLSLQERSLQLK